MDNFKRTNLPRMLTITKDDIIEYEEQNAIDKKCVICNEMYKETEQYRREIYNCEYCQKCHKEIPELI